MSVEMPEATGSFGASPTLAFPAGGPPAGLHARVLEDGAGPLVQAGQTITVNYHGQVWDGKVFDSSYRRGEPVGFPIGVGAVIAGWDRALVGKTVGSRVLVSIPPEQGYGRRGMPAAGIGGGDTLVFVVDIISAR
ncbi:MAG: FKBP-type peptidyl-prolyl cis-trans isomerase [Bifidobacteriaceae bacterium]|jgi:peptidylprolyl isomerase|nr:FKBP-type peptidyl-prolyl cis-trans isomerase [Bifidobacteriaceae bacterium]